jgi:hypothetical protein
MKIARFFAIKAMPTVDYSIFAPTRTLTDQRMFPPAGKVSTCSRLPFGYRHGWEVELIADARIAMTAEAADRVHFSLIDVFVDRIDRAFAHEASEHMTQDDFAGFSHRQSHIAPTFERSRRLGDPRTFHMDARSASRRA